MPRQEQQPQSSRDEFFSRQEILVHNIMAPGKLVDRLVKGESTEPSENAEITDKQVYNRFHDILTRYGKQSESEVYMAGMDEDENGKTIMFTYTVKQSFESCPEIGVWNVKEPIPRTIKLWSFQIIAEKKQNDLEWTQKEKEKDKVIHLSLTNNLNESADYIFGADKLEIRGKNKPNDAQPNKQLLLKLANFMESTYRNPKMQGANRAIYNSSRYAHVAKAIFDAAQGKQI